MTGGRSDLVSNGQRGIRVNVAALERFTREACGALGFADDAIAVQLISDAAMTGLNRKYRHKRGSTDVLSFPALSANGNGRRRGRPAEASYVGDIAISPAMARRNARRDGRSLPDELKILVLHGMIHLAGYDHETDQGQMARLEMKLRRRLGLTSQ
jgi:probable rRNA maturation factor